jgi:hypothetical protein
VGLCATCVKGVVGLAKAAAGVDAAPADVVDARRLACRHCSLASRSQRFAAAPHRGLTTLSRCGACSCFVAAKTRLAGEACPLGWWLAVPPGPRG